jgi:acyl-coenzyme A thioesterase 13
MNEDLAKAAFDAALASYSPGFGTFFLARLLGLEITYGTESCTVEMLVADWMFNPQGTLHGGIINTVLDIAMGHLLKHTAGAGATLQMNTQYLRAIHGGRVRAVSGFTRRGRSICFLEARLTDEAGALAASATSTWRLIEG